MTTADDEGNATLTVKLNKDITLDSVKTGNTTLNTNGVSNGKMNLTGTGMTITDTDASKQVSVTTNGVSMAVSAFSMWPMRLRIPTLPR